MTDQPKKTPLSLKDIQLEPNKSGQGSISRFRLLLTHSRTFLPLLSGALLMISGLTLVSITILGLITPLWISGTLSLLGSISSIVGVFLIYQTVSSHDSFESVVTKAIRRAVNSQN